MLEGFGFGAALLAMFMRVGGGIFTKAADVGADLVGKVEQGIPEDDPRNAATIADNVGDNVGDCAGMAADLFESYAVTLVAALILGTAAFGLQGLLFPLIVPAIGVLTAVIGVYITRAREGEGGLKTINRSFYISAVISAVLCVDRGVPVPARLVRRADQPDRHQVVAGMAGADPRVIASVAVIIGIVLAGVILWLTGYFTGTEHKPVKDVGESSLTGAATVILSGISIGFESAVYTALVIAARGVRRVPAGPGSIIGGAVRRGAGRHRPAHHGRRDRRDGHLRPGLATTRRASRRCPATSRARAWTSSPSWTRSGNTTKAITKGIAIATAVLAATALFGSYRDAINSTCARRGVGDRDAGSGVQLRGVRPNTLVGVIIGAVGRVHVLRAGDQRRHPGRRRDRVRGAPPVPGQPRDHGGHRCARSTAASSTSAPATRCASWPPPACWRSSRRSRSASASASARWPATWPAPSPPAP